MYSENNEDIEITAKEYESLILFDSNLKLEELSKRMLTVNLIYLICKELLVKHNYDKIVLVDQDLTGSIAYYDISTEELKTYSGIVELHNNYNNNNIPLFFIVNNDPLGGHWMAVIIYKDEEHNDKFYIFDSGDYNENIKGDYKNIIIRDEEIINKIIKFILPNYNLTPKIIDQNSPRISKQKNSWECGYSVCSVFENMILFGKNNRTTNYDGFGEQMVELSKNINENVYKGYRDLLFNKINKLMKDGSIKIGGNYKYKHDKYKQKYLSLKNI